MLIKTEIYWNSIQTIKEKKVVKHLTLLRREKNYFAAVKMNINISNTCTTTDKHTWNNKYNAKITYIFYCFIDSPKSWLFIIMVNTSISMKNKYTFFFSCLTIASIDAVVRPVIPLARKDIKTFWVEKWELWVKYENCFGK